MSECMAKEANFHDQRPVPGSLRHSTRKQMRLMTWGRGGTEAQLVIRHIPRLGQGQRHGGDTNNTHVLSLKQS